MVVVVVAVGAVVVVMILAAVIVVVVVVEENFPRKNAMEIYHSKHIMNMGHIYRHQQHPQHALTRARTYTQTLT